MMKLRHFLVLTIYLSLVTAKPSSSEDDAALVPFIINNSGNNNNNNVVNNGNDTFDGNLVNGDNNGDNENSGNVLKQWLEVFIINNSGNNSSNNKISNGNDDVSGNLVNGNGNGNNSNSGNVNKRNGRPNLAPFIINNSGNNNQNNSVENGDDDFHGNLVNGNGNGDNSGSGNIGQESERLEAYVEASSTVSSASDPDDELLERIDALLESIILRLNRVKVLINAPDSLGIVIQRVRETLVRVLVTLSRAPNFLKNKLRIIALSRLSDKIDTVTRLLHEKIIKLPEIIESLHEALKIKQNAECELIADLLRQVLGLLRALV